MADEERRHEFSTNLEESDSKINQINNVNDVLKMPYPMGCIKWCKNGMIISAGGGGPTKTGKANGFEILQFNKFGDHKFELLRHSWYNTGIDIVYCIVQHTKYPFQFIAAIGNDIIILELSKYETPQKNNAFSFDWDNIKKVKYPMNNPILNKPITTKYKKANIESLPLPHKNDPFCVHKIEIHPNGQYIVSGGTDGIIRLFSYCWINPSKITKVQEINIAQLHYNQLKINKPQNEAAPEFERLLFDNFNGNKSTYLCICNDTFACYVWNIGKNKMETILTENKNKNNYKNYEFRDCVFLSDKHNDNKYCICAVNSKPKARRGSFTSYLYQYYISNDASDANNEWYRIHYCHVIKSKLIRMICDYKSNNIITLHLDSVICVMDGLNLTKKYSFRMNKAFWRDIAISPNLYGNKKNNFTEYLLITSTHDVVIKPISLKPCYHTKGNSYNKCICYWLISIVIVLIAILIATAQ